MPSELQNDRPVGWIQPEHRQKICNGGRSIELEKKTSGREIKVGKPKSPPSKHTLSPRQVADLFVELYYVKKDTARLSGITEGFEM